MQFIALVINITDNYFIITVTWLQRNVYFNAALSKKKR